uniref:Putative LAGLIDADG homing endonuclease n=1 Tax=Gloeotilopsis planctonica TaxID=34157 RepID=A0A1B2RZ01_9CHLO|nr:putative LAGLIDADG homing endonuclease [Gloeotilopsis planctonica]
MSKKMESSNWNSWLAGLIDGDGNFYANKKNNSVQFSITMHSVDEHCLNQIKQKIGGKVSLVAGKQAVKLTLSSKPHLAALAERINGHLRNQIRIDQFKILCERLQIAFKPVPPFSWKFAYAAGFFDSSGTVVLSVKKHSSLNNLKGLEGKIERLKKAEITQLSVKITQKYKHNIDFLAIPFTVKEKELPVFGSIHYDKSQNGYFSWYITSRSNMLLFCNYLREKPSRTVKQHRVRLIPLFYELWGQKPYLASENSALKKRWFAFVESWFKFSS